MPLAFTQEDFLVIEFILCFIIKFIIVSSFLGNGGKAHVNFILPMNHSSKFKILLNRFSPQISVFPF